MNVKRQTNKHDLIRMQKKTRKSFVFFLAAVFLVYSSVVNAINDDPFDDHTDEEHVTPKFADDDRIKVKLVDDHHLDKNTKNAKNRTKEDDYQRVIESLDNYDNEKESLKSNKHGHHDKKNEAQSVDTTKRSTKTPSVSESESSSVESTVSRKNVPFFIAEDSKSIKLPRRDVIYNNATGEILVRNRHYEKDATHKNDTKSTTIVPNYYYNIKSDNLGFRNLQGFVIADSDRRYAKQYLYPVMSESQEATKRKDTVRLESAESKLRYADRKTFRRYEISQESAESTTEEIFTTEPFDILENQHFTTTTKGVKHKMLKIDNENQKHHDIIPLKSKGKDDHQKENDRDDIKKLIDSQETVEFTLLNEETTMFPILNRLETKKANSAMQRSIVDKASETSSDSSEMKQLRLNLNADATTNDNTAAEVSIDVLDAINSYEDDSELKSQMTTEEPSDPLLVLRAYMEDIYLRGPIAILIDTEETSLSMAREALNSMEQQGGVLNITDVVLVGYSTNGITSMSHHKISNIQQLDGEIKSFKKALSGFKPSKEKGKSSVALLKTTRLLPYDSAIFLFSNENNDEKGENDDFLLEQLLNKRIKLYVICSKKNKNQCRHSSTHVSGGGNVHLRERRHNEKYESNQYFRDLHTLDVFYDESDETIGNEIIFDKQDTVTLKKGLYDMQTILLPVDSSIKALIISISNDPDEATLYTPLDTMVNLLNETIIRQFSADSESLSVTPTLTVVRLSFSLQKAHELNSSKILEDSKSNETIQGIWKLIVKGKKMTPYDVRIDSESTIHVFIKVMTQRNAPQTEKRNIQISLGGPISSITEIVLVDKHGEPISNISSIRFETSSINDDSDIETIKEKEAGILTKIVPLPTNLTKDQTFYVAVTGLNNKHEPFTRLSQELQIPFEEISSIKERMFENNDKYEEGIGQGFDDIEADRGFNTNLIGKSQITTIDGLPMTVIQIGSASRLYGAPGVQMQVHFEITNNRENAVFFRFHAKDERYYLRSMTPQTQWINGGQTANVILTVGITSSSENNVRDSITFTATGLDQTSINAYVYVVTDGRIERDETRPYLKYTYRGDCMGYLDTGCNTRTWGLDITARDPESGILRIATTPIGLVYGANFYAGSRENIYARYTASCCSPRVHLAATDLNGNVISYDLDVSYYFTPASIAAIVLGILLFIALIVVAILIIRWIVKRKRDSRELPSYQTRRAS